ncbi:sensor histidine kinase [Dietzia psychralcaliphila]|uniref:sensor histidine kinase n=1 Tax=Dietzia psychralcaliphila TaxID=139021 RepID=UPI001C1E056C|nr:histidine kinase [Dietzia psychralcaliphila]
MWARLNRLFDTEDVWTRPLPENYLRADVVLALAMFACSAVGLEILRSMGVLGGETAPLWAQYLAMVSAAALLAIRRRYPLLTGLGATAHLLIIGSVMPLVMGQVSQQVLYFIAVYSAVAWARDRRALVGVSVGIAAALVVWMIWYIALGSGMQQILDALDDTDRSSGLVPPVPAYLVYTALINIVYFGGAAALGITSWRGARRRHALAEQAHTIEDQAEALRDRAVVEERLRIARELHDVIAHHVAAIGVQAGAARKVMGSDPEAAAGALRTVEESSRSAVGEMRALLGALRSADQATGPNAADTGSADVPSADTPTAAASDPSRSAGHGLADVERLAASLDTAGFSTDVSVVAGAGHPLDEVPPLVGLSLYRTAQEALANVRRHSTADRAGVVLRTGEHPDGTPYAEIEVLDGGRPRTGTSGSGLGLLGMRERVRSHGGECEIGPRVTGGYRVRVRLPYRPNLDGDRA